MVKKKIARGREAKKTSPSLRHAELVSASPGHEILKKIQDDGCSFGLPRGISLPHVRAELPFGFDTPHESPGFLLWQTTVMWQRRIKQVLQLYEVSHGQFVIMALLLWLREHKLETNQVQIVQYSKLDKMTVSQALKKLAAQGLVHRIEHETDTRAKNVTLTIKGVALVRTLVPLVEAMDKHFFGRLPQATQKILIETLSQLTQGALP